RDRDGHGLRAAVRHRDGGRPAAGDGFGLRRAADGQLAGHVARHRRDRRDLLRPGGRARPACAGVPARRRVDRARHGRPAGRLVRDRVLAAAAGPVLSGRAGFEGIEGRKQTGGAVMNEITRTGWDVLDEARAMLRGAVAGVSAVGCQVPTRCTEWNVTQVLQHAALDQGAWAAVISGMQPSGENPFAPSGELGVEPLPYADAALDASAPAWAAVSSDGGPVPTPLPTGPMPPADAAGAAALDAAIHAWDIAMATGPGSPLTPDLAWALTPVAK